MLRILKNFNPIISKSQFYQRNNRYYCNKTTGVSGGQPEKSEYKDIFVGESESKADKPPGPVTNALSKETFSKSILMMRKSGTLSSVNMYAKMKSESDTPIYGSNVPYAFQVRESDDGSSKDQVQYLQPIIALKNSDPHVAHLKHFSKVSLVIYPLTPFEYPPSDFDLPRINVSGRLVKCLGEDSKLAEAYYMLRNPHMHKVVNDPAFGFNFYKMTITDVYYYERDRKLDMIPINKFVEAKPDPICIESREVIELVNSKYKVSMARIAQDYGDVKIDESQVFMYFLDSYGFNCIGKKFKEDEWLDIRIPFDKPFNNIDDCKVALIEILNEIVDKK